MQRELQSALEQFFAGKLEKYHLNQMINAYETITKSNGMNPNSLISCDLAKLDYDLSKPQNQPQ